jgi:hypothetical protein
MDNSRRLKILPSNSLHDPPDQSFDWYHNEYDAVLEPLPKDAPKLLGNNETTSVYTYASL